MKDAQNVVRHLDIRIMTDNHGGPAPIRQEHGLSLWIEADNHVVLFDTGQGPALLANSRHLGLILERVDSVVLSHGHYDHAGGLAAVIGAKKKLPVYFHPKATQERFSRRDGKTRRIGMPENTRSAIESLGHQVRTSEDPVNVCRGVWTTGAIPRTSEIEGADKDLFLADGIADVVADDQALWIRTFEGIVVLLGCCHAGVINTLEYIRSLTDTPIRAVIGGMHLSHTDRPRWEAVEQALRCHQLDRIIPCHCTGEAATEYLSNKLGNRCRPGQVGDTYSF